MTIWFDVEDLFHYFRSGNKRISGIQRLTFEIYRAARELDPANIRFVRHGARPRSFLVVDWDELAIDLEQENPTEPAAANEPQPVGEGAAPPTESSSLRRIARRAADRLPAKIRRPLVAASVMQLQAIAAAGLFATRLLTMPAAATARRSAQLASQAYRQALRKPARAPDAGQHANFETLIKPGDTFLVLGAPWQREGYRELARWLRDDKRMRFGVLVHDLVPVRYPEWCHHGVPRTFRAWYDDVLPYCDLVLANSQHTAHDVEAYARESAIRLPGPVQPVPIGTGFGVTAPHPSTPRNPALPPRGSYVLFVATLEARKNHALAVRVWSLLVDEVNQGRRAPDTVPTLVFAGRFGWLIADLLTQLENTRWLSGKVQLVRDPTDTDLRALYEGCLFTLFPSLHEGWGLPVTESLALGKPCLSSNAAALPEAGGDLCRYFDPQDLGSAYRAIAEILDNRPGLAAWEERVRREFRPVPWFASARALLDAVGQLDAQARTAS
jgi:glycosyltransferase involved in cell wall biosynthesis